MRITDISVDGFGVWHDLDLRRLSPEVTVFHGWNEAGKTTLMQFLRSVIYGVSDDRRAVYLPPVNGGRPGGTLGVVTDDGPFRVSRYADRSDSDVGRVTIELPDGDQQGDRLLREAIEHVDEATFNNVFALGLDEIQHLGTLGGSAAAQWIYRLTSGLDRIMLYDVIVGLRASQRKLVGPDETVSEAAKLLSEKEKLEAEIAELASQTRNWCQRGLEMDEIDQQVRALREEARERERRARRVEVAMGIRKQWTKREETDIAIKALSGLYPLEANAIADLDELNDRIEEHERQRDILKGQRHQLRKEAEDLGINEMLVNNCCRIDGLSEQQEWLQSLAAQSAEFEAEADKLAARFEAETSRLAKQWFGDSDRRLVLSMEQLEKLAPQRAAMEAAQKQLEIAEHEFEAYRGEEERYASQLASATTSSERLGLPTNLQDAGEMVARLRRRLAVEQKIEQTRRSGVELEEQARDMLDGQVMPLRLYVGWGACVFGAAALLFAWAVTEGRPELGQVGGLLTLLSFLIPAWRWANEQRLADDLDGVHRQLEDLNRQLVGARAEKDALEQELPVADGSIVLRLQTAEKHLAELEDMLPVESERRKATEASRAAKAAFDSAKARVASSEKDWRGSLKALGLPEALTPKELNLLAGQYEQLAQLEQKALSRADDMARRQKEFDRVVNRIQRLAEETGLVLEDAEPLDQLEHLLSESRMQKARIEHREKLRERAKELKIEEGKHIRAAIGLTRKRESMFQTAGVDHETAFRELAADLAQLAKLEGERKSLTREIIAALGNLGTEEEFAPFFKPEVIHTLEKQWESLTGEHDATEKQLDKLLKERAQLVEQQRQLAEDTSLAEKQIELGIVEAKFERAVESWRERAIVSQMLERVRHDYELHRQPETLQEATGYFRELTGGKYTRVWTPLANDILFVDREDGSSLAVESLSRGTREQLYLSVRLALVAMFARRGIQLPMILDDVLVNYDERRAAVAARVMTEFAAEGHQLLVFTCHEHILNIFKKLSADCRRLPSRFGEVFEEEPEVEEEVIESIVEEPQEEIVEEIVEVFEEPEVEEVYEEVAEEQPDLYYSATILPRSQPKPKPASEPVVEYQFEMNPRQSAVEYDWDHDDVEFNDHLDANGQRMEEPLVVTRWE
jgi:uncharacterized protein YhaN